MRILVTGGAGFIGSHLVDRLVKEKHEIVVLDNLSTGSLDHIRKHIDENNITFLYGDIRNYDIVQEAVAETDCIAHLAGIVSVPYSIQNPALTKQVNVDGTLNLLNAAVNKGTEDFIFASTCATYGEARSMPITEEHPTQPLSPYAHSKVVADEFCEQFYRRHGLNTICLRLFNVYGPRQPSGGYAGVISQFWYKLSNAESPIIYGDGSQTRDFVHVDDVVSTISIASRYDNIHGAFNVGTGVGTTIRSLLGIISKLTENGDVNPRFEESRPGDIRHSQADVRKLDRTFGFKPEIALEPGLERTFVMPRSQMSEA